MKGDTSAESLVMTIIAIGLLLGATFIAMGIVIFTFSNQIKFTSEYAVSINKPYSIAEALVINNLDERNVLDHSLAAAITKDISRSSPDRETALDFSNRFLKKYGLEFYSIEITDKAENVIDKRWSLAKFCGTVEKKCNGQPCIAYCETPKKTALQYITLSKGKCSEGRLEYTIGKSECAKNEICCVEANYDWERNIPVTNTPDVKICARSTGICSKVCEAGRKQIEDTDNACKETGWFAQAKGWAGNKIQDQCCVPIHPDKIQKSSELGAETYIPLLYKITQNQPDGVLGYLIIGVSRD